MIIYECRINNTNNCYFNFSSLCTIRSIFSFKIYEYANRCNSHTVLLGIVLSFFITHKLDSPLLIVGATLTGLLTVYFVEVLSDSKLVKEDAAIGIVLSILFSIAVILISKYTANIHLDIDAVLLGEIAFAPFHTTEIFGLKLLLGL